MADGKLRKAKPVPPLPPSEEEAAEFVRLIYEELTSGPSGEGIGTLNEKRMHRILKRFVCDRPECFETDMGHRFVADIYNGERIYEIQTGSLLPLGKKLDYYINEIRCPVTVVHPVPAEKYLLWIDPGDGSVSPRRISPKKGTTLSVLPELVYVSEQLLSGMLEIVFLFTEEEEYRFLNGKRSADKKRGSERYERLPCRLLGKAVLSSPADVARLLPSELPSEFTASEFGTVTGLRGRDVYRALKGLELMGTASVTGSRGKARVWSLRKY